MNQVFCLERQVELQFFGLLKDCQVLLNDDKITATVMLIGPEDTPYAGGLFILKAYDRNSRRYLRFITQVFHPNVGADGWVEYTMSSELYYSIPTLQYMLKEPDLKEAVNRKAAEMMKESKEEYWRIAREMTAAHAH